METEVQTSYNKNKFIEAFNKDFKETLSNKTKLPKNITAKEKKRAGRYISKSGKGATLVIQNVENCVLESGGQLSNKEYHRQLLKNTIWPSRNK